MLGIGVSSKAFISMVNIIYIKSIIIICIQLFIFNITNYQQTLALGKPFAYIINPVYFN